MRVRLQGSIGIYGVESFVQSLAWNLNRLGLEISVTQPLWRSLVVRRPSLVTTADRGASELLKMKGRPDLVHINYAFASLPLLIGSGSRIPIIYTVHGVPQPDLQPEIPFKIGYILEQKSLRFVASRCAKVIAISRFVKSLLWDRYGIEADVIHNGVDPEVYRPTESEQEREMLRTGLDLPIDKTLILFVGRLFPAKDPLTLVRSMSQIVRDLPQALFIIVGQGPLKGPMIAEISKKNLDGYVRFMPYLRRSDLVKILRISNVYVSTAPTEMFGISVLEAMSCGVPVVAARSGGPVETLGKSGTFFNPRDAIDLAEQVCSLANDNSRMRSLGGAGRKNVLRDYRWERIAQKYVDAYRKLVE